MKFTKTVSIATSTVAATYLAKKIIDAARKEVNWYKSLPTFSVTDNEGREIKVKHMDATHQGGMLLNKTGILMAGCFQITRGLTFLATDACFEFMTAGDREFLINHEFGHIAHQDFKTMRKAQLKARLSGKSADEVIRITRNTDMEFAADEYAAEHIGYDKAIHALRTIREFLEEQTSIIESSQLDPISKARVIGINKTSIEEAEMRIENLRRKEVAA